MSRYQILDQVDAGCTAIVCRCSDLKEQVTVAVKLMPDVSNAIREIRVLCSVGHPSVIAIKGCFRISGCVGIVMPMVQMDLNEFIHRVPYSVDTMEKIELQAMQGLDHIHSRGIMHMDIKPKNIGVMRDKACEVQCKLLDFGSAVFSGQLKPGDIVRTTPGFMAPEMALGRMSFAADIYSAGKVFCALRDHTTDSAAATEVHDVGFGPLVMDMTSAQVDQRPSCKNVLVRMGDITALQPLVVDGPLWQHVCLVDWTDGDSRLLSHDLSCGLQRIVSLVRSDILEHIENAFWLLQEEARRCSCALAMLAILHFFHDRLHLTRLGCYFYARALEHLSRRAGFALPEDAKLHLWAISASCACERAVLRILARGASAEVLAWCCRLRWGSRQQEFGQFVERFCDAEDLCHDEALQLAARLAMFSRSHSIA